MLISRKKSTEFVASSVAQTLEQDSQGILFKYTQQHTDLNFAERTVPKYTRLFCSFCLFRKFAFAHAAILDLAQWRIFVRFASLTICSPKLVDAALAHFELQVNSHAHPRPLIVWPQKWQPGFGRFRLVILRKCGIGVLLPHFIALLLPPRANCPIPHLRCHAVDSPTCCPKSLCCQSLPPTWWLWGMGTYPSLEVGGFRPQHRIVIWLF